VLELLVASAAVDRLIIHAPQVDGPPVLVVSGIAALVMNAGSVILRGDAGDDEVRPASVTFVSRRSYSAPSQMLLRQQVWLWRARSSW